MDVSNLSLTATIYKTRSILLAKSASGFFVSARLYFKLFLLPQIDHFFTKIPPKRYQLKHSVGNIIKSRVWGASQKALKFT
jgi:hypothetical protein